MLERLRTHPFPVAAHFRHSLVLTYAFPSDLLVPLLPPGLVLDTHGDQGFAAAAFVQTERLRPAIVPEALGRDFFLSGYRIFVRRSGRESLRGLFILRSDTDRRSMVVLGNLLTRYHYRLARVRLTESPGELELEVRTPAREADVHVRALLDDRASLPPGSPFADVAEARRYAGPLPYTFDYDSSTKSLVVVRGVRTSWDPRPVRVDVHEATFFTREPFARAEPRLANAFHVAGIDYRWETGRVEPV